MGRDSKNEKRQEHFAKLVRNTMSSDAWRSLSQTAQALYPWLLLEWRGPKANNNGKIRLSVRTAADSMGCNRKTAGRAFQDLQAKGFLVQTEGACLGIGGEAKSPAYELTEIALPTEFTGRRLYKDWSEGHDFPVKMAAANNPNGNNSKTKPCPHFGDKVVPILGTKQ